jgi:hypothetical protein
MHTNDEVCTNTLTAVYRKTFMHDTSVFFQDSYLLNTYTDIIQAIITIITKL